MAIYTYGVENVTPETKHGIVRTTNLKATYAGHLFDVIHASQDLDNGMNVKIGDHVTADGRECVDATFPAVGDKIALVADVVKFYDTSTTAKQAEYNYYIPQGQPARAYEVEQYDKFGVSDYMFTTKVGAAVAVGNYVTVDGNGKWKEIVSTSAPDAAATGFIGKVYGFDTGDNEKIVLVETIQNVQIQSPGVGG